MNKTVREEICVIPGDAANLPFKENAFDAIYSQKALYWVPWPDSQNLRPEMDRVLKDEGTVAAHWPEAKPEKKWITERRDLDPQRKL